VEVVRGGVFDRTVTVMEGTQILANSALAVNPGAADTADWTQWLGGDIDDEYILTCTTAGKIADARFSLTSGGGDTETDISFVADQTEVAIGNLGLVAAFTLDAPSTDEFTAGDYWIIRVNACRPRVKISDTQGIDASTYVTVSEDTEFDLGEYGVTVTFEAASNNGAAENGGTGGLLLGDIFYVAATAATD